MSGGHWDYKGGRMAWDIECIANDPDVQSRWPTLAKALMGLSGWIRAVEHEMDWDLSSDSHIPNDAEFDLQALGALLDLVLKAIPEEHFERGKWATIQNWQRITGAEQSPGFQESGSF